MFDFLNLELAQAIITPSYYSVRQMGLNKGVKRQCKGSIFLTCLIENNALDTFLFTSFMWYFQLRFSSKCMPRNRFLNAVIPYSGNYSVANMHCVQGKVLLHVPRSYYSIFCFASI